MNVYKVNDFVKGWFVGPFEPSLHPTEAFECALKRYVAGEKEPMHKHEVATEYTVITEGSVRMNGVEYGPDSIIEILPGEATDFEALTDVTTMVVKIPGVRGDKYLV